MLKDILKYKYYLLAFLIIGFAVYFPILFNGFVWDDNPFLVNNLQLHKLNTSIFFDNTLNTGHMYRQVLVVVYTLLYFLFGANPMPYHFIQLLLHILCTSLIFFLFTKYFSKRISFFLCILFLIHPINAETVAWISAIQTIICTIFGIIAVLLSHKVNLNIKTIVLIIGSLFLSLLTYELGVIFFIVVLVNLKLKHPKYVRQFIYITAALFVLYFLMRIIGNALNVSQITMNQEIKTVTQKVFTIPSVILYYMKTLVFPKDLFIWQFWAINEFSFSRVVLPVIIIQSAFICYLWIMQKAAKRKIEGVYFFSTWFFVGFFPLLQIFQLDMTVGDRWFYIPFVGLLGILGILYTMFSNKLIRFKIPLLIFLLVLISLYSIRTVVRTFDWRNDLTLLSHDIKLEPDHILMNFNLAVYYEAQGSYDKALPYMRKVKSLTGHNTYYSHMLVVLAGLFSNNGNCKDALDYYSIASENPKIRDILNKDLDMYLRLSYCFAEAKKYSQITALLTDETIERSPHKYGLLYFRALAYYNLKNYEAARSDIEQVRVVNIVQTEAIVDLYNKVHAQFKNQNDE